jgi:hypothetical protein
MFSIEVTQHKRTLLNRLGSHYQNKFGVFGLAYEQLIYRHKHLKHKIVDKQFPTNFDKVLSIYEAETLIGLELV